MGKRYTETNKWLDPWFRKLSDAGKVTFTFMIENCNSAGYLEDIEFMSMQLGKSDEEMVEIMLELSKCYVRVGQELDESSSTVDQEYAESTSRVDQDLSKGILLKKYVYHQGNWPMSRNTNFHIGIIRNLEEIHYLFPSAVEEIMEYGFVGGKSKSTSRVSLELVEGKASVGLGSCHVMSCHKEVKRGECEGGEKKVRSGGGNRGVDIMWDKLLDEASPEIVGKLSFEQFRQLRNLAPDSDVKWEEIIDNVIGMSLNNEGPDKPWFYMKNCVKNAKYKREPGEKGPESKEISDKLAELGSKYRNEEITVEEYHKQREQIEGAK